MSNPRTLVQRTIDAIKAHPQISDQLRADFLAVRERFGWGHVATNGCLLGLVRQAWGEGVTITNIDGPVVHRTSVASDDGRVQFKHDGPEDVRLVHALESAP